MADSSIYKDACPQAVPSLIREALDRSPVGIYQVAALLTELLGVPVTREHLYAWSSGEIGENGRPFPLHYATAFCRATGDYSLLRHLLEQQEHSSTARQCDRAAGKQKGRKQNGRGAARQNDRNDR